MNSILRIMESGVIKDYDLSEWTDSIKSGPVSFWQEGGRWVFRSDRPLEFNGRNLVSGELCVGDIFVVDAGRGYGGLVLERAEGAPRYIESIDQITLGRKSDNHIEIKDRTISGHHCRFSKRADGWYVEDLNSTNGTWINDRWAKSARIGDGDIVKVGPYRFRAGRELCAVNADGRVLFHIKTRTETVASRPYPWFSPAPRMIRELPPLQIAIESAPAIGDKPSMGMGSIALSPQMMAISLGFQGLRYAMGRRKYSQKEKQRAEVYANYLAGIEQQLEKHAWLQREHARVRCPSLAECLLRVHRDGIQENLWERHSGDEDFLLLRLGLGSVPAQAVVQTPNRQLQLQEDSMADVPRQIAEKYARVEEVPIGCSLMDHGNCGLAGNRESCVNLAWSLAAQIAALHGYDEVKLVPVFREREKAQWDWMRWLPHCFSDDRQTRYMVCERSGKPVLEELGRMAQNRIQQQNQWNFGQKSGNQPHYVFLVAAPELLSSSPVGTALMMNQPELGISGIFIGRSMADFPHSVRNVVEVSAAGAELQMRLTADGEVWECSEDYERNLRTYERFARAMAPVRLLGGQAVSKGIPGMVTLFDGLGIRDLEKLDLGQFWDNTAPEKSLAVPIGIKAGGDLFYFDIHQKQDGTHGLVGGTTGSGKSKMAQTWIISMALQFSPRDVNFVLVDFKGDSLLQPFLSLPHLAGSISNLDDDVARSFSSMESELERRQALVSKYGCTDIITYLEKKKRDPSMPEMPYLILMVDEFAEFKQRFPDFTKSLNHIYQAGRSLGMFVILMMQSPSGVVTDQMRGNANFRWCLKMSTEGDSRELLDSGDAYAMARNPGRAYVKTAVSYEMIQSFYADAPYLTAEEQAAPPVGRVYGVALNGERITADTGTKKKESDRIQLEAAVAKIRTYCEQNHIAGASPVWQPVLAERVDLFSLEEQGETWRGNVTPEQGPAVVLGMVDDPIHQSQYALIHDFWKDDNLAVYGMPKSGTTTFLRTVMTSLCFRYTPEQVHLYLLDIGGYGLRSLETFPHVGRAAGNDEPEAMEAILNLLAEELERRKNLFRKIGAGSLGAYVEGTGTMLPSVFLIVDRLNQAGMLFPELNAAVLKLSQSGASYGIYLVCSFIGTVGVNYQLASNIKTTMTLRLSDKGEYNGIVGRPGASLPEKVIGCGYVKQGNEALVFQTAIPRSDLNDTGRIAWLRERAEAMDRNWEGKKPAGTSGAASELPFGSVEGEPFVLGADRGEGGPVGLAAHDLVSLLISDGAGVKEDLLIGLVRQATAIPNARIWLYSASPGTYGDFLEGHTVLESLSALDGLIEPLRVELKQRQRQLKEQTETAFSPMVVILDGLLDCVEGTRPDTVPRLEAFIRLGAELGFKIIVADTAERAGKCRFGGDVLTATLREGPILLAGGAVHGHQVTDTYELMSSHPQPLSTEEAWLLPGKGRKPVLFQRMHGE